VDKHERALLGSRSRTQATKDLRDVAQLHRVLEALAYVDHAHQLVEIRLVIEDRSSQAFLLVVVSRLRDQGVYGREVHDVGRWQVGL